MDIINVSAEDELGRVKACLAVAWGWMIAKGADDAALQAVGYLQIDVGGTPINLDN